MISKGNHVKFARFVLLAIIEEAKPWLFLFHSLYIKTIIRFSFCDIQNNQLLIMIILDITNLIQLNVEGNQAITLLLVFYDLRLTEKSISKVLFFLRMPVAGPQ